MKLITGLRHELHRHPELSLNEHETKRRLEEFLTANTSFEVNDRGSWFYAVKRGNDPEAGSIAFRADMDALPIDESEMHVEDPPCKDGTGPSRMPELSYRSENPGVSHKCGHDGHCAALCALALELDGMMLKRTVYLIFQHAEEIGAGGRICSELIDEKGISEVYAFHNLSGYPEGAIVYRPGLTQPASEGLEISFLGKASHAGMPEDGRNPAIAIAQTAIAAAKLSRRPADGMVLCTVAGMSAGSGDFGISAGEGSLRLTLRAEYEDDLLNLRNDILKAAETAAKERGIEINFQIYDSFPETKNTAYGIARVISAAEDINRIISEEDGTGFEVIEMTDMWRASEDFGHYLKKCEGAMFYIGNGTDWPPLHTAGYDFNDAILERAVDIFTALSDDRGQERIS